MTADAYAGDEEDVRDVSLFFELGDEAPMHVCDLEGTEVEALEELDSLVRFWNGDRVEEPHHIRVFLTEKTLTVATAVEPDSDDDSDDEAEIHSGFVDYRVYVRRPPGSKFSPLLTEGKGRKSDVLRIVAALMPSKVPSWKPATPAAAAEAESGSGDVTTADSSRED
jgi:hypothetical protein